MKALIALLTLFTITITTIAQSIWAPTGIGAPGRNLKTSAGFWAIDTALFGGKVWIPTNAGAGKILTSDANGFATWTAASASSAWGTTGNVVDTGKYIGTNNNIALFFKTNNTRAGFISTGSSVALGVRALKGYPFNSAVDNANTAIGAGALEVNTTGFSNTGIGNTALPHVTTGYANTAVGVNALTTLTTGTANTSFGYNTDTEHDTTSYSGTFGPQAIGSSKSMSFSPYYFSVQFPGIPTAAGYVLTDVAGDGVLTLEAPTGGGGSATLPNGRVAIGSASNTVSSDSSFRFSNSLTPVVTVLNASNSGRVNTGSLQVTNAGDASTFTLQKGTGSNATWDIPENADGVLKNDGVGNLSWQHLNYGVYKPDTSDGVDVTAFTIDSFSYTRVGNVVNVSGAISSITTVGLSSIQFTLPIATTLNRQYALTGVATVSDGSTAIITGALGSYGDATISFAAATLTSAIAIINLTYLVR